MKKFLIVIVLIIVFSGVVFVEEEVVVMMFDGVKVVLMEILVVNNCLVLFVEMLLDVLVGVMLMEVEMMEYIGWFKVYDVEVGEYMMCLDNVKVNLGDGVMLI